MCTTSDKGWCRQCVWHLQQVPSSWHWRIVFGELSSTTAVHCVEHWWPHSDRAKSGNPKILNDTRHQHFPTDKYIEANNYMELNLERDLLFPDFVNVILMLSFDWNLILEHLLKYCSWIDFPFDIWWVGLGNLQMCQSAICSLLGCQTCPRVLCNWEALDTSTCALCSTLKLHNTTNMIVCTTCDTLLWKLWHHSKRKLSLRVKVLKLSTFLTCGHKLSQVIMGLARDEEENR